MIFGMRNPEKIWQQ